MDKKRLKIALAVLDACTGRFLSTLKKECEKENE